MNSNPFKRSRNWWRVYWAVLLGLIVIRVYMGDQPLSATTTSPKAGTVIAYYDNKYQEYAITQLTKRNQLNEWYCLWALWNRESNWRPSAHEHTTGAYGIPQIQPFMWKLLQLKQTSNGFKQVDAGMKYIDRRYAGSPCKAYASSLARGWY